MRRKTSVPSRIIGGREHNCPRIARSYGLITIFALMHHSHMPKECQREGQEIRQLEQGALEYWDDVWSYSSSSLTHELMVRRMQIKKCFTTG